MSEQRLIDANAALSDLKNSVFPSSMTYTVGVDIAKRLIESAPTVDAVPVVHGTWEQHCDFDEDNNVYTCSVCDEPWALIAGVPKENNMHFCPNCGARMEDT